MALERAYVPIPCGDYEMLETACMDGYVVELVTRSGRSIVGKALALDVRPPEEFFVLLRDDGTTEAIRVDRIRHLTVLSRPSRFHAHTFANVASA